MSWQDWFITITQGAQAAADEALAEQRARVQETYDELYNQLATTTDYFGTLSPEIEGAASAADDLSTSLDDLGLEADDLAGKFQNLAEQLENGTFTGAAKSSITAKEGGEGNVSSLNLSVATPSTFVKNNVYVEAPPPPNVIVNVSGSFAALQARVEYEVQRQLASAAATVNKTATSKGVLS
jgi:hypothetical protein